MAGWWALVKQPLKHLVFRHGNIAMWGREKERKPVARPKKDLKRELKGTAKRETSVTVKEVAGSAFSLNPNSLCGRGGSPLQTQGDYCPPQRPPTVDPVDYGGWWIVQVQTSPRREDASSHLGEEPTEHRTQNSCSRLHLVAPLSAPSSGSQWQGRGVQIGRRSGSQIQNSRRHTDCCTLNQSASNLTARKWPEFQWN